LARVRKAGHNVTYSSEDGNVFTVVKKDGTTCIFKESRRGLFYLDTISDVNQDAVFITTIADKQYKYSNRDYLQATLARKIQKIIGRPSTNQFLKIIRNNLLPNYPIQCRNVLAAEDIFGPDLGSLKGKTVRQTPDIAEKNNIKIPPYIIEHYPKMYPFFVTTSRNIRFATSEMINDQRKSTIIKAMQQVLNIYWSGNFKVTHLLMDGQFEAMKNKISGLGFNVNTVTQGKMLQRLNDTSEP
jgi:hypothetical protein